MQYIRAKTLAQKLDVNVSTIWRWRKKNTFPEPIYLGPNTVVWSTKSIEDWITQNAAKSNNIGDLSQTPRT